MPPYEYAVSIWLHNLLVFEGQLWILRAAAEVNQWVLDVPLQTDVACWPDPQWACLCDTNKRWIHALKKALCDYTMRCVRSAVRPTRAPAGDVLGQWESWVTPICEMQADAKPLYGLQVAGGAGTEPTAAHRRYGIARGGALNGVSRWRLCGASAQGRAGCLHSRLWTYRHLEKGQGAAAYRVSGCSPHAWNLECSICDVIAFAPFLRIFWAFALTSLPERTHTESLGGAGIISGGTERITPDGEGGSPHAPALCSSSSIHDPSG